jgi:hypothetical protein
MVKVQTWVSNGENLCIAGLHPQNYAFESLTMDRTGDLGWLWGKIILMRFSEGCSEKILLQNRYFTCDTLLVLSQRKRRLDWLNTNTLTFLEFRPTESEDECPGRS